MPCSGCKELFVTLPCMINHNIDHDIELIGTYSKNVLAVLRLLHIKLKKTCPCQECIVRVMCKTKCTPYKNMLDTI